MAQITLNCDLTHDNAEAFQTFINALSKKPGAAITENEQLSFDDIKPHKPNKTEAPKKKVESKTQQTEAKKAEPEPKPETPSISLTDVRAVALKFSKAGKQAVLKEIFAKYGAEKLSDISASDYPALMADLEAANE